MSFDGTRRGFCVLVLALTALGMPAHAAPFTDKNALGLSQSQLLDRLRTDLPFDIVYAHRQNMRGLEPFVPDAPATVAYYTRPKAIAPKGLCYAQRLLVSYDTSGNVTGLGLASLYGVPGRIDRTATFSPQDGSECSSLNSGEFFSAPDGVTAAMAAAVLQQVQDDATTAATPHYALTCVIPSRTVPACTAEEQKRLMAHIRPRDIGSAQFVSCEDKVRAGPVPDAHGHFCLEIEPPDTSLDHDSVLVEGERNGQAENIEAVLLTHTSQRF